MLSQMVPFYITGGLIAVAMFIAAMAAEGRGAHILRLWLESGRKDTVQALKEEALVGDVPRDPNTLSLVSHLGAAERRYTELDARRVREEERASA
ncbi:hypothetical protein [Demequina sp.]|uniref:hypothetical protein n=1 Tax=Demequina sp. TaxID=2050685 RepID=UPI003D1480F3